MTPETRLFLNKAFEALAKADGMLDRWPDEAGRMAYLAGFHAAQAFIFETTGKSAKSHKGVHAELHRLTRGDQNFDANLRSFLGASYTLKAIADYETNPDAGSSPGQAREAIELARRFVAYFDAALSAPPDDIPDRGA